MNRLLKAAIAAAILSVTTLNTAMAKPKTVELRLIETTDVHGSFFSYDFTNHRPKQGSMARVSSYLKQVRSEHPAGVVLLDNGDILQGQPTTYYYNYVATQEENVAASIINYLGYDAQGVGNHDVETGHAVYDKWAGEVKAPVLAANVIDTRTGQPYFKPYTIVERQGVRIAVLGLLTPAIPNWLPKHLWTNLRFEELVESARKWVGIIRQQEKPDVVVGLFHSGREGGITTPDYVENVSLRVAQEVEGFDIVFFGHDHTRFNETVKGPSGTDVLCLNPANNAMHVAEARLTMEKKKGHWTVKQMTGELVDMRPLDVDADFETHFKPQTDAVHNFVDRKIGTFKHAISTRDCYFGNSAFNDLILRLQLQVTGADISMSAPLALNAEIKEGDVTVGDMFNLYKYENALYTMRLTGREIRGHLEMSYGLWTNQMTSPDDHLLLFAEKHTGDAHRESFRYPLFNFDAAAGIDYEVDVTKPVGQRVKILRLSDGREFKDDAWYTVALNSYRGNGGGELLTRGAGIPLAELESRIVWRSDRDLRHYLMQEIERMGTVDAQPGHNWRFVPEEWAKPAAERDRKVLFPNEK